MTAGITRDVTTVFACACLPVFSVVIPLSTEREAERIAENYVEAVSRVEDKLKLSNPDVADLIFIPFERDGNKLRAPPEFGNLVPGRIRNTDIDRLIIL